MSDSSAGVDPLECLRETIRHKGEMREEGDSIVLTMGASKTKVKLSKSTETAYMVKGRQVDGKQEYYTLNELVFFYKHKDTGVGSYMKAAKAANLRFVPFAQKKSLEAYLSCAVDTSDDVDTTKAASHKQASDRAEPGSLGKRKALSTPAKDGPKGDKEAAPLNQRDKNMRLWRKR